jgi:hypothetical protein
MIIGVGDIVEFVHSFQKYQGIVIEISGEYCYVCFFDKSINFGNSIPYHVSSLTLIASSQ